MVLKRGMYRYSYMKCYIQRSIVTCKTVIVVCKQCLDNLMS